MPGVFNLSVDEAVKEAEAAAVAGLGGMLLFGLPESKDENASGAHDPNGIVQHASYNADLLGRSVAETLRLVQAVQTGERCPVEWKPGAKTLGKPA